MSYVASHPHRRPWKPAAECEVILARGLSTSVPSDALRIVEVEERQSSRGRHDRMLAPYIPKSMFVAPASPSGLRTSSKVGLVLGDSP
jgi:hypothetical protein